MRLGRREDFITPAAIDRKHALLNRSPRPERRYHQVRQSRRQSPSKKKV